MYKKSLDNIKGLTLIEIMLAVTILSVGILGLLSAMVSARHMDRTSQDIYTINLAMQTFLEQARDEILQLAAEGKIGDIYGIYGTRATPKIFSAQELTDMGISLSGIRLNGDGANFMETIVIDNESDPWLGTNQIDMDLDGSFGSTTHNAFYRVFPLRITVRYLDASNRVKSQSMGTMIVPGKI